MDARLISFGLIEIDGRRFGHDVVVEGGVVRRRKKAASKAYRDQYGHTPLSPDEAIPWSAHLLIIGTGVSGQLPIMPELYEEARRRGDLGFGDQDRRLPEGRPPSDPGWSRGAARIAPSSAARIELEIPRVVGLTLEVGRLAVDREQGQVGPRSPGARRRIQAGPHHDGEIVTTRWRPEPAVKVKTA